MSLCFAYFLSVMLLLRFSSVKRSSSPLRSECVLCAATSPAGKLKDETLTYLNQCNVKLLTFLCMFKLSQHLMLHSKHQDVFSSDGNIFFCQFISVCTFVVMGNQKLLISDISITISKTNKTLQTSEPKFSGDLFVCFFTLL